MIVNVPVVPIHPFAVGVTLNVAIEGVVEEFVNGVDAIELPLPLAEIPIELKLFVHENVDPLTALVKFIRSELEPLHFACDVTEFTAGVGFTVTEKAALDSEMQPLLSVTVYVILVEPAKIPVTIPVLGSTLALVGADELQSIV